MSNSKLNKIATFVRKFKYFIITLWAIIIIISIAFIPNFFGAVVYDLTDTSTTSPEDSEAQQTLLILEEQFPSSENQNGNSIILVIQDENVYSNNIRKNILTLNNTFSSTYSNINYTGVTSIYSVEYDLLTSLLPDFRSQINNLSLIIELMNEGLYDLENNLTLLYSNLYGLERGINETSQLVYCVPVFFTSVWYNISSQNQLDPFTINIITNNTFMESTSFLNNDELSLAYYSAFFNIWNQSFLTHPSLTPFDRSQYVIDIIVPIFIENYQIDFELGQIINLISTELSLKNWNNEEDLANITINSMVNQIPPEISKYFGISAREIVLKLYSILPPPNPEGLSDLTLELFEDNLKNQSKAFEIALSGVNTKNIEKEFINMAYVLGESPSHQSIWNLSSRFISRSLSDIFSDSPIFTINEYSLYNVLIEINKQDINSLIADIISNYNFNNYPIFPSKNIVQNFISSNNSTMLVIIGFNNPLESSEIAEFKEIVTESDLYNNSEVYITGNSVFSEDMAEIFSEAEGMTIIAGIAMSLIIAGLLFRSPIAAVFPLLIAGISILISYPAIYFGVVVIGQGTISFLTPILTVLLLLGLGVDYSVILLRRTREERLKGKSKEDSVTISTRWAGQAVITAAIAVITSYIVMAVAQVPTFSDVGISIAIGVSVLLLVAITLIPSLELILGDRLFWPGLKSKNNPTAEEKNILPRIADYTLKRKFPIIIGIGLLGLSSFYLVYITPTGMDFQKLLPDFDSNRGITEIVENMGSDYISPTQIVLILDKPIINNSNQFNLDSLNTIDQLTNKIKNLEGISSVTSTTQPFNSIFDYAGVYSLSEPIRSQYLNGMLDSIGNDNRTVLFNVGLMDPPFSSAAIDSLLNLKYEVQDSPFYQDLEIHYGGTTQSIYESQSLLDLIFPRVVIILVAAIYVLLFLQLWSAFTPLRLIYTVLTSVVVSLALIYSIFYFILDIPIASFIALFVVVTMLGVGIDYDIFLVTRIREEVLLGKSDNDAIKIAISKTAGTIMGLGLILSSVFGSLIFTGMPILQEIGMAVSGAVIFDTFIVILLVVPALMGLAQSLNWWPTKPKRSSD